MKKKFELMFPLGRLVEGNLYTPNEEDMAGKPLTYRSGAKAGEHRVDYYMALAVAKGIEQHWSQTPWGQQIVNIANQIFTNGATQSPNFHWKISDGDSTIPNQNNRRPCDKEGFKGHWIIKFNNGYAPTIVNRDGSAHILEENYINPGDYIEVFGYIVDNGFPQGPGLKINHRTISFQGFGDRIVFGPDPKSLGFGKNSLPAGASLTPKSGMSNSSQVTQEQTYQSQPMPVQSQVQQAYQPPQPQVAQQPITPHPGILNPQQNQSMPGPAAPIQPTRIMTPKAAGYTYEQMINSGQGWTDKLLVEQGYMIIQ